MPTGRRKLPNMVLIGDRFPTGRSDELLWPQASDDAAPRSLRQGAGRSLNATTAAHTDDEWVRQYAHRNGRLQHPGRGGSVTRARCVPRSLRFPRYCEM